MAALSPEAAKKLRAELAALSKLQFEVLANETYLGEDLEETRRYDERPKRMEEILRILGASIW